MKQHRLKLVTLIVCLALGLLQGPAFGWEFNLSGAAGFTYQYYTQQGKSGFFGPYNVDAEATSPGTFAPANGWLGPQVANIVSGADASRSNLTTLLFPQIRVNPALSLQGVYRIGNNDTDAFPGATTSFAFGEWLQWYISANTPWGLVAYGKRPFYHGCGLQYDASNRTQEHLALITYYGPLTMGLGFYPWRQVPQLSEPADFSGVLPFNQFDKSTINSTDLYGFVDYAAGPFNAGIAAISYRHHVGPEAATAIFFRSNIAALDANVTEGAVYMKYNNGRFFFNAEADWYYSDAHFSKTVTGLFFTTDGFALPESFEGSDVFRPRYTEMWRYMVELGAICGPAKLSLLTSYVPGPDRRHGVLIDRQSVLVDLYRVAVPGLSPNPIVFSADHSNNTVFRPYSIIFNNDFGSGLGATSGTASSVLGRTNDGYIVDARVYAARLDYAVAANLNVFGSLLYATRVSHGYGWGYIRPSGSTVGFLSGGVDFTPTGSFAAPSPAIPDDSLGYEVDLGMNWNLLENWMVDVTAGYWQPGKWFNFACISKTVPAWDVPTAANNFGINPDRSIDPIFALVARLTASF